MSTIADFQGWVAAKVQDDSGKITATERDQFIQEAVTAYSQDRPLVKVADLAGDGGYDYDLPSDFLIGFSVIRSVEYPAGQRVPVIIERGSYRLYHTASATTLRFLENTPQSGETARVTYTALHVVDATSSTIPGADEDAVVSLAASFYCRALAAYYAQTGDPTLGADVVNYRTKAQEYTALADRLERLYRTHVGRREGETTSAMSRTVDWDTEMSTGLDYLFHRRKQR